MVVFSNEDVIILSLENRGIPIFSKIKAIAYEVESGIETVVLPRLILRRSINLKI